MKQLASTLLCLALSATTLAGGFLQEGPAMGDVVVVVSPSNPVTSLTRNQVIDLFLGRTSQFPDGRHAVPVDQSEHSATRQAFNAQLLGRSAAQVRAHWAKVIFTGRGRPPVHVDGAEAVKRLVSEDPRAIGYIERRLVDGTIVVVAVE